MNEDSKFTLTLLWLLWIGVAAFWIAAVYVMIHFIVKFW